MTQDMTSEARVKRERFASRPADAEDADGGRGGEAKVCNDDDRRVLRSHYKRLKASIADDKEQLISIDSHKFDAIVQRVDDLHSLVNKPREQIADAEALLDITDVFLSSLKDSRQGGGIKASDLVCALLQKFSEDSHSNYDDGVVNIDWQSLGAEACVVLHDAAGMCTMLGPMDSEPKRRKVSAPRRRDRQVAEEARPEIVEDGAGSEQTQTDKNIRAMFNILRKTGEKGCQLDHLVLNRDSFAETVENIFFLSFLVKDGRAQITIEDGKHIVAFRYAPTAAERFGNNARSQSQQVVNSQFVFRFDFKDWMTMRETVDRGEELMPKRTKHNLSSATAAAETVETTTATATAGTTATTTTPIRKNSRNRGRVTLGEFDECNLSVDLGECQSDGAEYQTDNVGSRSIARKSIL